MEKFQNKNVSILLTVIILMIVAGGGYLVIKSLQEDKEKNSCFFEKIDIKEDDTENKQLKQGEISNWQIYKNTKYGFEFKYLAHLLVLEKDNEICLKSNNDKTVCFLSLHSMEDLKNYVNEPGPGQHYAGISLYRWQFILRTAESGNCTEEIRMKLSEETVDGKCEIVKESDYVRIEMYNETRYYTLSNLFVLRNYLNDLVISDFKLIK